jgi:hypothetical protein
LAAAASEEARAVADLAAVASAEDTEEDFTADFTADSDIAPTDIFTVAAVFLAR